MSRSLGSGACVLVTRVSVPVCVSVARQAELEHRYLIGEQRLEVREARRGVVKLEEALGVERPERRERSGLERRSHRVVGQRDVDAGAGLTQLCPQREDAAQQ